MIAIEESPRIHLQQVAAVNDPFRIGNAVNNLVIDAGANAGRKSVIALEAGGCTHFANPFFGESVEITSGLPRFNLLHDLTKHSGNDAAGLSHDLDFTRRFDLDAASFLDPGTRRSGPGSLGIRHQIREKIHQPPSISVTLSTAT